MTRAPDYALRAAVVQALQSSDQCALTFDAIQKRAGGSNWNLRMTLDYLVETGVVHKRGRKGVPCTYWLSGREFDSGRPKGFDCGELARVWG